MIIIKSKGEKMNKKINKIYSGNEAKKWYRDKPQSISDFVGKERLLQTIKKEIENKCVLDLGCGEGYITRKIAKTAKKIIGIDLSQDMIDIANQTNKYNNVSYLILDIKNIEQIKETFDVIVISLVLHYFTHGELKTVSKKIAKLLRPGGKIYILGINTDELIKHKSSVWIRHKKFQNIKIDSFLEIKCLITCGEYKNSYRRVGFYYYKLEHYIKSFINSGLDLINIKYLSPTKKLLKQFPSMESEKNLYVLMIFEKNDK